MKKLLSVALSVLLILSAFSVLMILPTTAATTGPVNLITNGDASMGVWGDHGYETIPYGEEGWGMIAANNAYGWRSAGYITDANRADFGVPYGNANIYWQNRGAFVTAHPTSISTAPSIQVNRWNQTMQDIELEAGKTYKVSADVTFNPNTTAANYSGSFDIAIVNKAGQFIDQVNNKYSGVTGKSYDLCDSGDAIYNASRVDTSVANFPTFTHTDGNTYWDFGDFKTYSFTFAADDVINDYALVANENGAYAATLAFQNDSGLVMLIDNVSVYEVVTITAGEGGTVNTDAVIVGETATLIAKPYYGNGFAGWYAGDNLVSTNATYQGVVTEGLTAKFNIFNQIVDGDFESGTTAGVDALNAITAHYGHPGACYNASLVAPVGSTASKHGNNVAQLNLTNKTSASNRQVLNIPVTIEKNKTYYFETAVYNIDTNVAEPRYNVVFTPSPTRTWNGDNIAQYVPTFTFNFYSEKNGVSTNTWSWQGAATVDSGKTVKNSAFELNSAANVGVYQPNEWSVMRFIFESGDNEALFGANDTVTINLQLGAQGSASTAGRDLMFDNMFFGEASSASAAPTAAEGGYIKTSSGAQAEVAPMYIKSTASGAAFGANDKNVSYYPVVASNDVATAYPYFGNTFAGWYDSAAADAKLLSTNATYSGGKPGVVAKFNKVNQIDNGNFEDGDVKDIHLNKAAYGSSILTDADGNKFFRMQTTTTGNDLYAYQLYFTVEKNKKYIISYDLRSGVDENGNLLSTAGSAFRRMVLERTGENKHTWGKVTFADGYTLTAGNNHTAYHGTFDAFPSGGTDLNPTASSSSFPGTFNKASTDWTHYSVVLDTSSVKVKDVETAGDTVDLSFLFGPNGACTMALDIDNIVISEVNNEVDLSAGDGGYASLDRIASTAVLPATFKAYPVAGFAFKNWTDAEGNVVSEESEYSTFEAVELKANFESQIPETNNNGGFVADNGDGNYIAKAHYGNVFVGWYNLEGLVSTSATIPYGDAADCIATFIQYNQIIDGNFENGQGLAAWQGYEGATSFYLEAADGLSGAGMRGYSNGDSLMATKYPLTVKKNSSYVMQFNMKIGNYTASGTSTPVWAMMLAGSPDGNGWGHWPKVDSYKLTINLIDNPSVQYVTSGNDTAFIPQIHFATLEETFGNEWVNVTIEIAFDDDTSYSGKGNLFANSDTATVYAALGHNKAISQSSTYYDNFSFYEKTDLITFEHKENVRPSRDGIGPMAIGTTYSFTLDKAADVAATVTVNGNEITAANGIYSFVVENKNAVVISLANDDEYPEPGKDFEGNSLTAYNHDLYTKNIWDGEIVYHETALIYKGRTEIQLMYPVSDIVSVRSYDLQTSYVEGYDFEINEKGNLVILEGSKIPVAKFGMIADAGSTSGWASDDDGVLISEYSDGTSANSSIVVTYTHGTEWAGAKQTSVASKLSVYDKLKNGEDVHIVTYGDSMSSGWSASGGLTHVYTADNSGTTTTSGLNFAPYMPNWMLMFIEGLKKTYPDANITWENLSLGGKASEWGLANFAARYELLKNKDIDLFMIGWGINDNGAGHTVEEFKANDQGIIDAVRAKCPNTSILLYGANCTNTYSSLYDYETLMGYEGALHELAKENTNIAATNLTSIFMDVVAKKEVCDLLGNNLNHANDFGCRIYAQTMLSAMAPVSAADGNFDSVGSDISSVVNLNSGASASVEEYTEADKAVNGYDAETMGDGYLKVTANPNTGSYLDVGFPVELVKGEKYLAHFKLRMLSILDSARFDVRIDTKAASWSGAPAGIAGKVYASLGRDNLYSRSNSPELFGDWISQGYDKKGYVDFYMVLDTATLEAETQTAYINVGLRTGGDIAIDNFSFVNVEELAPTMAGAMIDIDGSTVHYVTNVKLPAYVSMNRATTHMIAKHYIDTVYPDRAFNFDFKIKEAGFASTRADETTDYVLKTAEGEVMRKGNLYTTYEGFDAITPTARILARTEITLSDNYGNSLGIVLGTNNTNADKAIENGVYSRSLTQIKRLTAKALIESSEEMANYAASVITPVEGRALWNCDINEVWAFVLDVVPAE